MSDLHDKPKISEIRQVDANQSLPEGYRLIDLGPIDGIKKPRMLEVDGGLVAHFDVPEGWEKRRNSERLFLNCHLTIDGDVEVVIGDLGIPIAAADCIRLKKLFRGQEQSLSGADVVFLQQAINYGSRAPILVQSARVHDLTFERVIDFIGRYNFSDGNNRSIRCALSMWMGLQDSSFP